MTISTGKFRLKLVNASYLSTSFIDGLIRSMDNERQGSSRTTQGSSRTTQGSSGTTLGSSRTTQGSSGTTQGSSRTTQGSSGTMQSSSGTMQGSSRINAVNNIIVSVFAKNDTNCEKPLFSWSRSISGETMARNAAGNSKESRGNVAAKGKEEFTESTLDDLFSDEPGRRGTSKGGEELGPKMEDFDSFEEYIEALVSHERESSQGRSKAGGQSPRRRPEAEENRQPNSGTVPQFDRGPKKEWKKAAGETKPKPARKAPAEPDFSADDDLELFLNSLDNPDFEFSLDSILNEKEDRVGEPSSIESRDVNAVSKDDQNGTKAKDKDVKAAKKPLKSERAADPSEWSRVSLELLTVPTLKGMLKERGLQVSGKKAELIDRYMTSLDAHS